MTAALALIQETLPELPETSGYLRLGYLAIFGTLATYTLFLLVRARRAGKDHHAQ